MATRTAGGNVAFHNFHNDYAHIADPNERRRLALAEIDKAPFGWYHVRAIIVAGVGFFTVSPTLAPSCNTLGTIRKIASERLADSMYRMHTTSSPSVSWLA